MKNYTCKDCINLVQVNKHPWNKGEGKGRVTERMGYVCLVGLRMGDKEAFFIDSDETVGCELISLIDNADAQLTI